MKTLLKLIIIPFGLSFILNSCEKEEKPEFIFKGQFINGTTMKPTRTKETMTLTAKDSRGKFLSTIGTFTTDEFGKFEFKYQQQKGNSITMEDGFFGRFENLPINQNFERNPWFFSDWGTLKLKIDLSNYTHTVSDTLFIGYISSLVGSAEVISIISQPTLNNNITEKLRLLPIDQYIFMGVGAKNFKTENNKIKYYEKRLKINIKGDPFVDSTTFIY